MGVTFSPTTSHAVSPSQLLAFSMALCVVVRATSTCLPQIVLESKQVSVSKRVASKGTVVRAVLQSVPDAGQWLGSLRVPTR